AVNLLRHFVKRLPADERGCRAAQRIGQLALLLLALLKEAAFGNVLDDGNKMAGTTIFIANDGDCHPHPYHLAILADIALLVREGVQFTGKPALEELHLLADVVGVRNIAEVELEHLVAAVAGDLAQAVVHPLPVPLRGKLRHADSRMLEDVPETPLALA